MCFLCGTGIQIVTVVRSLLRECLLRKKSDQKKKKKKRLWWLNHWTSTLGWTVVKCHDDCVMCTFIACATNLLHENVAWTKLGSKSCVIQYMSLLYISQTNKLSLCHKGEKVGLFSSPLSLTHADLPICCPRSGRDRCVNVWCWTYPGPAGDPTWMRGSIHTWIHPVNWKKKKETPLSRCIPRHTSAHRVVRSMYNIRKGHWYIEYVTPSCVACSPVIIRNRTMLWKKET